MFQKRSLTTGFLVASLGIAAGLAVVSSPTVAAADDCGGLSIAEVISVCKNEGGKDGVKKMMKKAMEAANAAGGDKLECKSCHADQKEYKLSDAKKAADGFNARMKSHFPAPKK
jgi:hypothetical protein